MEETTTGISWGTGRHVLSLGGDYKMFTLYLFIELYMYALSTPRKIYFTVKVNFKNSYGSLFPLIAFYT